LLDQVAFQIVGVLPQSFEPLLFTDAGSPPDVLAPLGYDLSLPQAGRRGPGLRAIARLRDGIGVKQARAEMNAIYSQLAREFPKDYPPDATIAIVPLRESWYGKIKMALWLLFGATGLVLLIACANVANLLLAQAAKKRREVALRSVLGASRLRIVRQLVTESIIFSLFGAIGGAVLAAWGTRFLLNWAPDEIPGPSRIHFDVTVLLFALGITTVTGLLIGLLPAVEVLRAEHREALQQASRTTRGSGSRFRGLLVSSQVCLAFVLTLASGLLLKSFVRVWNVNPGFNVQHLYEVNFKFIGEQYEDENVTARAQMEALKRIRDIPGVESAALVSTPPIAGSFGALDKAGFHIQDRHMPDPQVPSVDRYFVSPDYFSTLEIPLVQGRVFSDSDAPGGHHVAIISESAARQFFPGENPLGKNIQLGGRADDRPWAEVVGIVGDVRQYGLDSPTTPQAYLLCSQSPFNFGIVLFARSKIGSGALTRAIEEQIRAIDKNTLVFNPAFMSEILSHSLAQRRFTMALLAVFGALALVLAAVGVYGVVSYMVVQRTGEIGVRMALGAQTRDVLRFVQRDGMFRAGVGLLAGLIISVALTRVLTSQLYEVDALDPLTFGTVFLLLTGIAVAAGYIPARRAARVDPMVALRYE
jgi:putative ABC transport system permease protein